MLAEEQARHVHVPVEVRVVHGQAAGVLLEESRSAAHVVLSRRPGSQRGGHLGTTARALLRRCMVPVHLTGVPGWDGRQPATRPIARSC
jgi:hypothetical protein